MEARLPAHLEVSSYIRAVQAEGGFGTVLSKGERDAGTIMLVLVENGENARAYERMPGLDGTRAWHCTRRQEPGADFSALIDSRLAFSDYIEKRGFQDPDLWIVELDVAKPERFIGLGV
ncbi:MAG: hypothetical protein K0R64_768 [Novosphingobium lindaniclasticum]|jgi:hypothetical protein|uniref:DUF1491 family protein n=1 Tax=Novosphingobium lindaniclasticum TaxID=1329895 RepID=UPI002409A71C|nr:DUF1491 family protein [Novosphingobium lindaniclasticum]MDF2637784.1 hypothetical protein [Novosphingobium lindaniclasticum]